MTPGNHHGYVGVPIPAGFILKDERKVWHNPFPRKAVIFLQVQRFRILTGTVKS